MPRIKEPPVGISHTPAYKSPPSRIVRSLRKAYDNSRTRLLEKSKLMMSLQGKLRDTQKSREDWKAQAKAASEKLAEIEKKNQILQEELKKRG
jgi:chromosome segregation ATPase